MKLNKVITINGKECQLVNEQIALDIDRPARAIFQVVRTGELSGTVTFSMGWHFNKKLTLFFTGEIEPEQSVQVDNKQQRLFCREVSARLDLQHPIALRHPTLKDVLAEYANRTGLSFIVPPKPYATTKVPTFYTVGSGFHSFANIGAVFNIPDYVWLTQGDGKVFVGSHADSMWHKKPIELPSNYFSKAKAGGKKTITAIPPLRVGATLNNERIVAINFSGHEMELTTCKAV